ncbi:MAG: TraR/DksA family transcriptional regulator [Sulfitobacter sp.]|jgi:RNA polymerase-binding transcription factor DksA|nr:TraR/DksA family transcriptional regulator [Sulfitobacter sp.]
MNTQRYKKKIQTRLAELQGRLQKVEAALDEPADPDLEDQAIELEDDEVLESVGRAGLKELNLLNAALGRIDKGTYGICTKCGENISDARLDAVLFTMLCRDCANAGPQGPV